MVKNKNVIPKGDYCYSCDGDHRYQCPYWRLIPERNYQENGFCDFLGKGDYELNREEEYKEIYIKDGKEVKGPLVTAEEIGIPLSLLWDKTKMCDVNVEDN